jgi:uncharacterized GH25 family protein
MKIVKLTVSLLFLTATLPAHNSWINPLSSPLKQGTDVEIQIAHGHSFPESEQAMEDAGIEVFAVGPGGARASLPHVRSGKKLLATYKVPAAGFYRFAFVQDRGVMSRTPGGLKKGGRDKNPDAISSSRYYRSGVAYAATRGAQVKSAEPLGLEFEIVASRQPGALEVMVLCGGHPCAGADVIVKTAGGKERNLGRTAASGTVTAAVSGLKGPVLIEARKTAPAPRNEHYDSMNLTTSLYLELD